MKEKIKCELCGKNGYNTKIRVIVRDTEFRDFVRANLCVECAQHIAQMQNFEKVLTKCIVCGGKIDISKPEGHEVVLCNTNRFDRALNNVPTQKTAIICDDCYNIIMRIHLYKTIEPKEVTEND